LPSPSTTDAATRIAEQPFAVVPPGARRIALQAAGVWAASRIALGVVTYFAVLFPTSGPHTPGVPTTGFTPYPPRVLLGAWAQFDGRTALTIAAHGYTSTASAQVFPLYPLLVRLVAFVGLDAHRQVAATLVSNLAALGAFIGICLLAGEGREPDMRPLLVAATFPLAFVLAAPTADALFVALAVFALYFARRSAWLPAAVCSFFAALTSLGAVVLLPAVVLAYGRREAWLPGGIRRALASPRALLDGALVLFAVPLGVAVYGVILGVQLGQPVAFLSLGGAAIPPAATSSVAQQRVFADLLSLLLVTGVALGALRRQPVLYTAYSLGLVLLGLVYFFVGGPDATLAPGRLLVASVPVFIALAHWLRGRPAIEMLYYCAGFLFQALFLMLWLTGRGPL
jgi:hypothetical protein